jgi:hypothetical protein
MNRNLPTPNDLYSFFSAWPEKFIESFNEIRRYAVFFPESANEYLAILIPLLNVQWEICYASSDLSLNPSLEVFYQGLFSVLRRNGARFDWAVQHRPWQHSESSYGAFLTRKRAICLMYHLEQTPSSQTWTYKEASLPGYVHFDPRGYSGWSQVAREGLDGSFDLITDEEADEFHKRLYEKYVKGRVSKYEQQNDPPPHGDYYFFPLQMIDDSVQKLARIKMLDLAMEAVTRLVGNGHNVVFKRHPKCNSSVVETFLRSIEQRQGVTVSTASIHDLIAGCEAVITINSGVGFEALIHLKPVFVAGECDYQAACHILKSVDDVSTIPSLLAPETRSMRIKKVLYYLLTTQQCRAADEGHIAAHLIRTMFVHTPSPASV